MLRYVKYILLTMGLFLFYWMIRDFGIGNILLNLRKAGWWIIPAVGIWAAVYMLNSLSFYIILGSERKSLGFLRTAVITISGFAINYITPFASVGGEPFRIFQLKKYIPTHIAVSKVVLYKMIQLFSHFILWLITIPLILALFSLSAEIRVTLIILFFLILSFVYIFLKGHKNGLLDKLYLFLIKIRPGSAMTQKLRSRHDAVLKADENIRELYNERKKAFWMAIAVEFSARLLSSLEFYFIILSLSIPVTLLQTIYINSLSSLVLNIFFFVPLELGVRESGMLLVMQTIYAHTGIGVFIAIMNRIRELFWIFFGLALIPSRERKNFKPEIQMEP
ncbi:MAG: lysylphosphatidylglycerol synthase transmembrane domain-containing protein [Bacteroidota bacterium]